MIVNTRNANQKKANAVKNRLEDEKMPWGERETSL